MSKWKEVWEQGTKSLERRTSVSSGLSLDAYVQTNGYWEAVISIRRHSPGHESHGSFDFLHIAEGKTNSPATSKQRADAALERFLRQMKAISVNFKSGTAAVSPRKAAARKVLRKPSRKKR